MFEPDVKLMDENVINPTNLRTAKLHKIAQGKDNTVLSEWAGCQSATYAEGDSQSREKVGEIV